MKVYLTCKGWTDKHGNDKWPHNTVVRPDRFYVLFCPIKWADFPIGLPAVLEKSYYLTLYNLFINLHVYFLQVIPPLIFPWQNHNFHAANMMRKHPTVTIFCTVSLMLVGLTRLGSISVFVLKATNVINRIKFVEGDRRKGRKDCSQSRPYLISYF